VRIIEAGTEAVFGVVDSPSSGYGRCLEWVADDGAKRVVVPVPEGVPDAIALSVLAEGIAKATGLEWYRGGE
jgi:hypothetical protein